MNLKFGFEKKGIVVTGGAQGIGFQIAQDFLAAGARVSIWDYSEDSMSAAKTALAKFADQVHFVRTDVSQPSSCKAAADSLPFKVDVLVNNAGITRDKSFAKMTDEEFDAVIRTNLNGIFYVTKAVMDKFNPESTHRRIINLASVVALYGNFGQTNYVAAKAGVIGITKTLSRELGKKGFTVNSIAPGFISTPMTAKMPPEVLKAMADKVPVARMGETRDIANACLFLAAEESSYINGTVMCVDGGLVC